MGKRVAEKSIIVLFLLFLMQLLLSMSFFTASAADSVSSTELSDEVMQQAMDIISSADESGLTEEAKRDLEELGLTDSQIEMLQSLSEAEGGSQQGGTDWNTQAVDLGGGSAVLFISLGIVIAALAVGVSFIARWLFKLRKGDDRKGEE